MTTTLNGSLTEGQTKVLATFRQHGALTDYELGYAYRLTHGELDQSWSGLRTRRAELVGKGFLFKSGEVRNENGRWISVHASAF